MSDSGKWSSEKTVNALPLLCERLKQGEVLRPGTLRLLEGDKPVGIVLLEQGRVCWALSQGLEHRLTDLLVERHGLTPADVENVYRHCRERRVSLADGFVTTGALSREAFERVLMQHTAEAFRGLARLRPTGARFLPHRGHGYEPSVSFPVQRVLAHAVCLSLGIDAEALEKQLAPLVGEREWAAVFEGDEALPICVVGDSRGDAGTLLDLGRWARHAFTRTAEARLAPRAITVGVGAGTLMAAEQRGRIVVVWSQESAALARFLGRYARGDHGYLRSQ